MLAPKGSPLQQKVAAISAPTPFPWHRLPGELKLAVLMQCGDEDVMALARVDLGSRAMIAQAPMLAPMQRAFSEAKGNDYFLKPHILEQHLLAFQSCTSESMGVDIGIGAEALRRMATLRAGRGPQLCINLSFEECLSLSACLPSGFHIDLNMTTRDISQAEPRWHIPPAIACLMLSHNVVDNAARIFEITSKITLEKKQPLQNFYISNLAITEGLLDLSGVAGADFGEVCDCTLGGVDHGLRWPTAVQGLRLVHCCVIPQNGPYLWPQGLKILDMNNCSFQGDASQYPLPPSLSTLHLLCCDFGGQLLPPVLPPALQDIIVVMGDFSFELEHQVFPETMRSIRIGHLESETTASRKTKLRKRNWQRALKARHPQADVRVR